MKTKKLQPILATFFVTVLVGAGLVASEAMSFPESLPSIDCPLLQLPENASASQAVPAKMLGVSSLGRLEPYCEIVKIAPPAICAQERVAQVCVVQGRHLRKGDVLAVMDSRARLEAALVEAQERVAVSKAQLARVLAGAKQGELSAQQATTDRMKSELQERLAVMDGVAARLKAEYVFAKQEADRYEALYKDGAVSCSARDQKVTAANTAWAQIEEARAEKRRVEKTVMAQIVESQATFDKIAEVRPVDVDVAKAEMEAAQAAVNKIKTDLDLAYVRAPYDGEVLKVFAHPGEISSEKGIAEFGQTYRMVAVAEVYESDIGLVHVGQHATISSSAFSDSLKGEVFDIGRRVTKQNVYSAEPGANFDNRVVEVRILLSPEASKKVAGLSNLQVEVQLAS